VKPAFDRVLITGATGQVGSALLSCFGAHRCIAPPIEAFPLHFPEVLEKRLDYFKPTAIFNAAAFTQVDLAESPDQEPIVEAVNHESPARIARWCNRNGVPLVHFSTDYVYSGQGTHARREDEPTGPLNTYGRTKLAGDAAILSNGAKALILRTSWVYDSAGTNFFRTMLRLGKEKKELRIVSDQVGAPTYAPHLAHAAIDALEAALGLEQKVNSFATGIYHLVNSGETSWHGFAQAIFEGARAMGALLAVENVLPIETASYPTAAARPLNSRLDTSKIRETLGVKMPSWQTGLEECLPLWRELEQKKDTEKKP
jgi:dTDP-4-dehydrorhamnose reductase